MTRPAGAVAAEARTPLTGLDEARRHVLARIEPVPAARLSLHHAAGLLAAEPVVADRDLPGYVGSAMDGYALRAADLAGAGPDRPALLDVLGTHRAGGADHRPVRPGTAATITTGAPLPAGADAVAPWEVTERVEGPDGVRVAVHQPLDPGAHVRAADEQLAHGEQVVAEGDVLDPARVALLASLGRERALVRPRPSVAVLATGDEVVPPGAPAAPGQVHDANTAMLAAVCRRAGARVVRTGLLGDRPDELREWLIGAAGEADLLVTAAGVSVGQHDWVRDVVGAEGAVSMWRVAIKPGKPTAFGHVRGTPLLALPGNPHSALVAARTLLVPALRALAGLPAAQPPRAVRLAAALAGTDGRTALEPVVVGPHGAAPVRSGGHLRMVDLAAADGLVAVPPGGLPAGASVDVEVW